MRAPLLAAALVLTLAGIPAPAAADHNRFLVAFDAAAAYGDTANLRAQLLDPSDFCPVNPCPVAGAQVDFFVDGAYQGTDVTNSGGFALLNVASPAWHPGDHVILARYDRFSNPGNPATDTAVLAIAQEATLLAARDGYLEARLTDDEGSPLAGLPVRFYATSPAGDHDLCTAFTDPGGDARCTAATGAGVSPLDVAAYTASFDGTADYVAASDGANLL